MLKRKIEIFGKCWGVWRRAHYEGSIRFYRWENSKSSSSSDCKYISNICTNLSKIDLLHIAELSRFCSWLPKRLTISYKSILVSHIKVTLMNNSGALYSYAAWYRSISKLLLCLVPFNIQVVMILGLVQYRSCYYAWYCSILTFLWYLVPFNIEFVMILGTVPYWICYAAWYRSILKLLFCLVPFNI